MEKEFKISADTKEIKDKLENTLSLIGNVNCIDDKVTREELQGFAQAVHDYLDCQLGYIDSALNDLYRMHYEHTEAGHVPPLSSEALSKLIDILNLNNTYQVTKRPVFSVAKVKDNKGIFLIE